MSNFARSSMPQGSKASFVVLCRSPFVSGRIRRFCASHIRNLCTGRHEGGVDVAGSARSGKEIAEDVAVARRGRGRQFHDNYFFRTPGWPWVSVVPSQECGYTVGLQESKDFGKDIKQQSSPRPEDDGSFQPSPPFFRLIEQRQGLESTLSLFPMTVPEKISCVLSKYGWTAHTLVELRTMMVEMKQLKPAYVFEVLSRQRHAEIAFNFLEWALSEANCRLQMRCFTVILPLLGRLRKYDLLEKLLRDLDERGYALDKIFFTAAIMCYAEGQKIQRAMELFVKMKKRGFEPDCVTYSVLITMFSRAKFYNEALNLYQEVLALGIATDTQLYNCVIGAIGKAGRLDLAYKKLEEMRERGHIPDQFTYGVLLEGFVKAGRLEFKDLYKEIQYSGTPLNEVIFNIMFLGIERMGTISDAEAVFADMEKVGLSSNLNAFSTLIGMFSKKGDAEGAQSWFDKMTSMGLQPTVPVGNSLLESYGKTKQFGKAKQTLNSFQTWGLSPNLPTLTVCVRCLTLCESPEDLEIVQKMLSCHSGSQFLSMLLQKSDDENLAPVISLFLSSLHVEKRRNRRDFINVLINYLYKIGFWSQAYQVWEGALANHEFPTVVEQGSDGICSVNLMDMESGTGIISLTHTLSRLGKQFHRREMTPEWVQIYTDNVKGKIPNPDPSPMHQAVELLLQTLHSPFRLGNIETGGGFVCRGEAVMFWLDEPDVKAMLAFKQ